jgi:predicted aspartyl protease
VPSITGSVLRSGILIEVTVGVSFPREQALIKAGLPIPVRQHATFIVDTGADRTTVDEQMMRALEIPPETQTRVVTLKSGPMGHPADTYATSLQIKNASEVPWTERTLSAIGESFHSSSIQGIIGRDVLDRLHLDYNGPAGRFYIRY